MIRRFSAALVGLALILPIVAAAPVGAHVTGGLAVDFDRLANDDIVGTVTNHTSSRRANILVTATFENGTTDITASATVMVTNLAPHSSTPFEIDPPPTVTGLTLNSVTASGAITTVKPSGGLHVEECTLAGDVCTGNVTNDAANPATNVQVYATRGTSATSHTEAQASAVIPTIGAGATVAYVITFEAGSTGDAHNEIAKTNSGTFYTSWNNYFGDLGTSPWTNEIAFLADEGITLGCGNVNYCPLSNVTREQMALFLQRALTLTDTDAFGFTDIGALPVASQDAINALANAGITGGCQASPLKYCPADNVTRGQMSKFIVEGYNDEGNKDLDPIPGNPGMFSDDNGHFSEPYNNAMGAAGITLGCGSGRYCPHANVTREQMAVFIFRAENLPDEAP